MNTKFDEKKYKTENDKIKLTNEQKRIIADKMQEENKKQ